MGIVELSVLSAGFVNGSSVAKTLVFAFVVVGQMFPIFQLLFLYIFYYSFISPTFPTVPVPQEESACVVRVYHASTSSSSNSSQEVSAGKDNVSFVPSLASLICVDTRVGERTSGTGTTITSYENAE